MGNSPLQEADIVHNARNELASGCSVEKGQGETIDVAIDGIAQVPDNALPNPLELVGIAKVKDTFQQEEQHQSQGQ